MIEYTPNAVHIPCDCERCVKIEAVIEHLKKIVSTHDGSDYDARRIFDEIQEILGKEKPQRITSTKEGRKFLGDFEATA